MRHARGWIVACGCGVIALLGLRIGPAAGAEPFAVYENWRTAPNIRSDRWSVTEAGTAQEIRTEIDGHRLLLRQRREGAASTDFGAAAASQALAARNPAAITQLEVDLEVDHVRLESCASNPGQTLVRPVLLDLVAFNDATGDGRTGDHYIRVQVQSEPDMIDRDSELTVQTFVVRCLDPGCVAGAVQTFESVATVPLGRPLTLRAIWERENARFLVGVNRLPDVVLPYDPALDQGKARVPFATLRPVVVNANCTTGPAAADLQIAVGTIRTNRSAIIP